MDNSSTPPVDRKVGPGPRAPGERPLSSLETVTAVFIALLARGLWPVGIYPKGAKRKGMVTEGKEPFGLKWGLVRWTLAKFRELLEIYKDAGCGLCLGPGRGPDGKWLIDVEGDGPEAEESRAKLFGGEVVPTLGWGSTRGGHQVYTADGERFGPIVARLKSFEAKKTNQPGVFHIPSLPGLELRFGGYKDDGAVKQLQSVVPPTPGTDGKPRAWNGVDEIADAPGAFYAGLEAAVVAAAGPAPASSPGKTRSGPPANRADAWLKKAHENGCGKIAMAPSGERHPTLMATVRTLAGYLHYWLDYKIGFTEEELISGATDAADRAAPERKGDNRRCVEDAIADGKAAPLTLPDELHAIAAGIHAPARNGHHHENGDGRHATIEADPEARPVVVVTNQLHEVVAQAVEALSRDPEVFQRGTSLVRMVRNAKPPKGMRDTEGTPQVLPINVPRLLELLSRCADWKRWGEGEDGEKTLVAHSPSEKFAKMVADRCDWPGIRPLEGIIEAPTLRPDGSILQEPGYDHDTGLYLLPNAKFPPVPENPSHEDAKAAIGRLLAIVADFPFESDAHRYAWLASCLTVVARFVVAGPVPLFLFDANTAGSGKTKLCDVNAIIATGRPMPRSSYSQRDEETQKQLLAIALGGFPFVLFDNLQTGESLGGPALDKALTSTSLNERLLGSSKMSGDVPFYPVLHATGNNLGLKGDALRRIIPSRLESPMERPEERDDFVIEGDLLAHVRKIRTSLVVDALTIVRAYVVAGKPTRTLTPMDYPAWSGVIRNAIHWASGIDPCSTRQGKIAEDDSANELAVLIGGWEALCRDVQKSSLTAAEALQAIETSRPIDHLGLKAAMAEWSKDGKLPSVRTIGARLKKVRGRVSGGKSLDFKVLDGNRCWLVKPAFRPLPSGFGGSSGSAQKPPTEQKTGERESEGVSRVGDELSHFEPLSHFTPPPDPGEEVVTWEA